MRFLDNTKMGPKLTGAFLLVAAMLVVVGGMAVNKLHALASADQELYGNMTVPLGTLGEITGDFHRIRANIRDTVLASDRDDVLKYMAHLDGRVAALDKNLDLFEKTLAGQDIKAKFAAFKAQLKSFEAVNARIGALAAAEKDAEAVALLRSEGLATTNVAQKAIEELTAAKVASAKALSAGNTEVAAGASQFMYALMALAVLAAIALGWILTRSITAPLAQGVAMMAEMGKGHLSARLKMQRRDELGDLARAMDTFTDTLQGIVGGLQQVAQGDLSREWVSVDAKDEIAPALKQVRDSLNALVEETGTLIDAAKAGSLGLRARQERVKGVYARLLQGNNEILDAVVRPINEVKRVMGAMERGDLTARITEEYQGDLQALRNEQYVYEYEYASAWRMLAQQPSRVSGLGQTGPAAGRMGPGLVDAAAVAAPGPRVRPAPAARPGAAAGTAPPATADDQASS